MKSKLFIILVAMAVALQAMADGSVTDSLTVFKSWEAVFDCRPDTVLHQVLVEVYTPYDFNIKPQGKDKRTKKMLKEEAQVVLLGDSMWLVNSDYLKREFKGDCKHFSHYLPLYFSSRIAFVQWQRGTPTVGGMLLNMLVGGMYGLDADIGMGDYYLGRVAPFYLIDFGNKRVEKVDYKFLLELLDDYRDLRRRFEQMRDCEEQYMVNEFFLEYVERLNGDNYWGDDEY